MGKNTKKTRTEFVHHPRFGDKAIPSEHSFTLEEIKSAHWSYRHAEKSMYPETAIAADTSKQNYSIFPRSIYVDLIRTCRSCERLFIFFAKEQKHWFEELGFWIDADCVHCPECRLERQHANVALQTYSEYANRELKEPEDILKFADLCLRLIEIGTLKKPTKLFENLKLLEKLGDYEEKISGIKTKVKELTSRDG